MTLTPEERERYGADVSFAGSAYLNRRHTLAALTDCGLRVWGPEWQKTPLAGVTAEGGRRFTLEEMAKISAATRINLNLHSAEHVSGLDPDPDYVNPRTFELAACGAFQLVDARDPLPDLFTAEEVATYTSVPQLRELIAHYLPRAEIRTIVNADPTRLYWLSAFLNNHPGRLLTTSAGASSTDPIQGVIPDFLTDNSQPFAGVTQYGR